MRHSSVLFLPVNVDRPKPLPFQVPSADGKAVKGAKRKPKRALLAGAAQAGAAQAGAADSGETPSDAPDDTSADD
jgi:hypothetical protein